MTKKRYFKNYPKLTLNTESKVHDWEWIMKQPENKNTLKKLFGQTLLEKAAVILDFEQELYINGIEDHGKVQRITKSSEGIHIETMETELRLKRSRIIREEYEVSRKRNEDDMKELKNLIILD